MTPDRRYVDMQPAYVLHLRAYQESNAIVELITPQYGRVSVVAKGVRTAKSKRKGLLQPFYPLLVSWTGRGELFTLTKVEPQGPTIKILSADIMIGFYINELLYRLLARNEANIELFSLYDITLRNIASLNRTSPSNSILQAVLRRFEMQLLQLLGYGLVLDRDIRSNQAISPQLDYDYQHSLGPVAVSPGRHISGLCVSGRTLICLANSIPEQQIEDPELTRSAKTLLRFVLDFYLGTKPLVSRQLYQEMQNKGNPSVKN